MWRKGDQGQVTNIQTFKYTEQNHRVRVVPPPAATFFTLTGVTDNEKLLLLAFRVLLVLSFSAL